MVCYAYTKLVTICYQIIKRPGEGIAGRDGAGWICDGACDLHRQI